MDGRLSNIEAFNKTMDSISTSCKTMESWICDELKREFYFKLEMAES